MDTIKPCCQPTWLRDGRIGHYERICFIFGEGLCQPFYDIPYIKLYVNLVRKLNGTNYMNLRRVYRRKVDHDATAELVDARIIKPKMIYNEITVGPDSRSIPSQILNKSAYTERLGSSVIHTYPKASVTKSPPLQYAAARAWMRRM